MGLRQQKTKLLIHHFLEDSAQLYPDKIALIHEDHRVTYDRINGMANQFARRLIDQGIKQGDRVVLILENCLEYVVGYYGTLKAGAIAAPLRSDIKPNGLRHLLGELEPIVVVSSSRSEKCLKSMDLSSFGIQTLILRSPSLKWSHAPFSVFEWADFIKNIEKTNPRLPIEESALAGIMYTSGSTGMPKGAMLSHRNIVSNTRSICQYLQLTEKDIQMVVLPFCYVMGKSLLNTHFASGGTLVINNKFAYPASVIKQMVDEQVTGFSGVPSTYAYLLHRSPLTGYRHRFGALRYCSQAGGHMSRRIKEELRNILPAHTRIYIMYGATEASARLTYLEPEKYEEKIDSIGKPIPEVSIRVLDKDGREARIGQTGELVVTGPNIMQGYWKDEQSTKDVFHQNGYRTGDMGYRDAEGYFYLVGRKDNLLKVGGHRINPQEVEDALLDTGLVVEVAVIGIQDKLLGQRLVAAVVPKNGDCSENQILRNSAEKLPKYKLPGKIKFVRALPKNITGKIDREKCVELF